MPFFYTFLNCLSLWLVGMYKFHWHCFVEYLSLHCFIEYLSLCMQTVFFVQLYPPESRKVLECLVNYVVYKVISH